MRGALLVIGIIVVGFILFYVYFIFKQIEFVVVSVNLYRKMVRRQDAMIKLLVDIRDKTTNYRLSDEDEDGDSQEEGDAESAGVSGDEEEADPCSFCFHCGEELPGKVPQCPKCGKRL